MVLKTGAGQLGTVGILLGAAAFTNNAQIKIVGKIISFILVATALLVWSEVFISFKQGNQASERLRFFIVLLFIAFLSVILYWALEFTIILRVMLAAVLLQVIFVHTKELRWFRTTKRKMVLWFVLVIVTTFVAFPINQGLNWLHQYLISKQ